MTESKRRHAEAEPSCFEYARRVQFADTDMAGIVHFSSYYRYMEEAEHAFFRSLGETVHTADGIGWPRLHASCDFFRPMRFEDEVRIRVSIRRISAKTVRFGHNFWLPDAGGENLLAAGSVVTVCVRMDPATNRMHAVSIPGPLRVKLEAAQRRRLSATP